MIDLLLVVFCSWRIYTMAVERGLSAWGWVTRFVSGYFVIGFLFAIAMLFVYGKEELSNMEGLIKHAQPWTPFVLLFLVFWFIFLRSRILRHAEAGNDNHTDKFPSDPGQTNEKPDLSYFR